MFEVFFDNFIKKEQNDMINKIFNELNENKTYNIHNLIMSGEKYSVLNSILTQLMELKGNSFILICHEYLVKDSILILLQYRSLYIRNLRYVNNINKIQHLIIYPEYNYVLSDMQFKYWILLMHQNNKNNNEVLCQFYILYDEINTILELIKSNFNNIIKYNDINDYIKPILYNIYIK